VSDLAASSTPAPVRGLPLRLLSDERLARLTTAGSDRAFAVLYERHHQALYRYCRTIVRHDEDARDVLQTTMARALAALGRGVPDAPIRPWLFRIAHNEVADRQRHATRHPTSPLDLAAGFADPVPSPEERAIAAEASGQLRALLGTLAPRERAVLELRLADLSTPEIAAVLGVGVASVWQAQSRGLAKVRDAMRGPTDA
jgi:RNA polymerase sigma factor (sigma-70 family)